MYNKITELSYGVGAKITGYRKDFHKYAESGWLEMRTASIIARKLTELNYKVLVGRDVCMENARMGLPDNKVLEKNYKRAKEQGADLEFLEQVKGGFTGVIGILDNGDGPVIALRFDIDALGVIEDQSKIHRPAREGFSSVNSGMMHACGHDGHAAIGLGIAEVLMSIKDSLKGKVKLIFQPAEEGVRGARSIVEKGHLDDVDYVMACHITGREKSDKDVDVYPGSGGAFATTKMDVCFHGKSAHAAGSPQEGKNSILAAAIAILNLYAISRNSISDTRINVGMLRAGTGRNVIADIAKMEIEVRGKTTDGNLYMEKCAERIIQNSAEMYENTFEIKKMGAAFLLESDKELMERIKKVCEENLKGIKVHEKMRHEQAGSEDFSYMMKKVQDNGGQASMLRVLTDAAAVAHNNLFDFDDEEVLPKAVKILSAIVYDMLRA